MIAIPPALIVERYDEQVASLQRFEHGSAIVSRRDRITQRPAQPVENRRLQQEIEYVFWLAVKHLFSQVVQHKTVATGECLDKTGRVRASLHREGRQLQ